MDLHNNEVGYDLIESNSNLVELITSANPQFQQQGLQELLNSLCYVLSQGEMLVFSDPSGANPDDDPFNTLIASNSCSCIN